MFFASLNLNCYNHFFYPCRCCRFGGIRCGLSKPKCLLVRFTRNYFFFFVIIFEAEKCLEKGSKIKYKSRRYLVVAVVANSVMSTTKY